MHQRVLRVNSVFQSKNIRTLPAHLKKVTCVECTRLDWDLRPWGQGNSDTSLHTPLRRDAWSLSAPQKARQAWLLAMFGSFSLRQVDANRREELSVKRELKVFVCVDPNTFHHSKARFPWLMQESTDFSQYQSIMVMRGCVCTRVAFSGCTEIWYVGMVGLFQAACGNKEWKRP